MGRITVFTCNDLHSKTVKALLEKYELPFVEISLENDYKRRGELHGFTGSFSIPQVFFNTRFVGGVSETRQELERWANPINEGSSEFFSGPLAKYKLQIESASDPVAKALALPEKIVPSSRLEKQASSPCSLDIDLPDGTTTSVADITEKLRNTLAKKEIKRGGVLYKHAITEDAIVDTFKTTLALSNEEAMAFGRKLVLANVLSQVVSSSGGGTDFNGGCASPDKVYRLQCDRDPSVLNSYCVWNKVVHQSHLNVYSKLDALMGEIEGECSTGTDGKLDYRAVQKSKSYPMFEEAVCELQCLGLKDLSSREKVAFGLNIYHLMIKYAFMKVGMITSEAARNVFMSKVKFNVGTQIYSFEDWVSKVILATDVMDPSKKQAKPVSWMNPQGDDELSDRSKVVFALNVGAYLGCTRSSPCRSYSAQQIDGELDIATRVFLEDSCNLDIDKKSGKVRVSKVISWYNSEFPRNDKRLLLLLSDHLSTGKKITLRRAMDSSSFSMSFVDVDYTRYAVNYATFDQSALETEVKQVTLNKILRRFRPPSIPRNEDLRLSTLRRLNVLDTLAEERFDRITRMVQETFGVPLVFVSLVEENRQWFKSKQWLADVPEVSETSRDVSFCGHTILGKEDEIFHIPDATQDDRFAENPLVTGPLSIRFYAGCNLSIPAHAGDEKVNIGTLCIIDQKPRDFDREESAKLRWFARQVREEILRKDMASVKQCPLGLQGKLEFLSTNLVDTR